MILYGPLVAMASLDYHDGSRDRLSEISEPSALPLREQIRRLEKEMKEAAKRLEFEEAAALRDRLRELRELQVMAT